MTPRQYLGRREQMRLLMLVMSLGIILLAIQAAAKPENWYWLWGGQPPAGAADETDGVATATGGSTTVSAAPLEWVVDNPLGDQLAEVEDNQPFRAGEHDVFYELLSRLAKVGAAAVNGADVAEASSVQLAAQPAVYRGEWVRFRGTVRQVKTVDASANEHGIQRLYQLWVQHDDDPRSVLVVYCTELPDQFPRGEPPDGATTTHAATADTSPEMIELRERVAITGISLKRWPYHAQDGMRTAPLVLTASPAWSPATSPVTSPATSGLRSALPSPTVFGVTVVSAIVIAILIVYRGSRPALSARRVDEDTTTGAVAGMKLADTQPDHVSAMRQHDDAADGD